MHLRSIHQGDPLRNSDIFVLYVTLGKYFFAISDTKFDIVMSE